MELSILKSSDEQTMTSKEIAELTGKTHSNVMVDVRKLVQQLYNEHELKFQLMYENIIVGNGAVRKSEYYQLTKKETLLLVSGYNVRLRLAIIDRWEQLENEKANQFKIPQTLSEALLLAGNLAKENETLQLKQKEDEPKVIFFDQVTGSDTCFDIGVVAKVCNLGVGRNNLFAFLRDNKVLQKNNLPYQQYIDKGYFRVIEGSFTRPDGSVQVTYKTVVFQKGVDFIIRKYNSLNS